MKKKGHITLAIVLQHVQHITVNIQAMEQRLSRDIQAVRTELGEKIDKLSRKVDLHNVQITNIGERLDDIEVVQLPRLRKAIRAR